MEGRSSRGANRSGDESSHQKTQAQPADACFSYPVPIRKSSSSKSLECLGDFFFENQIEGYFPQYEERKYIRGGWQSLEQRVQEDVEREILKQTNKPEVRMSVKDAKIQQDQAGEGKVDAIQTRGVSHLERLSNSARERERNQGVIVNYTSATASQDKGQPNDLQTIEITARDLVVGFNSPKGQITINITNEPVSVN